MSLQQKPPPPAFGNPYVENVNPSGTQMTPSTAPLTNYNNGVVGKALNSVGSAVSSLNPLSSVGDFLAATKNTLFNRGFWIRGGTLAAGIVVILLGFDVVLSSSKTVQSVATTAIKGLEVIP